MTTRRLLIAPVLVALLVAGCSDDTTPAVSPTSASASPSAAASPDVSADAAIAAKVNLTAADLGAGWISTPAALSSAADNAAERALYACIGSPATDPLGDDIASPDFSNATGGQISSSVDVYADEAQAKAEFASFSTPKAADCLRTSIRTLLTTQISASGGTVESADLVRRKDLEVVPDSLGFRFTAKFTAGGQSSTVDADVLAIRRGRIGVQVMSFAIGGPFPADVLATATKAVAARAEAQAG